MMNIECQRLTGMTCEEVFAGWDGGGRISRMLDPEVGGLAVRWIREMRRQSELALIVEEADEFLEDGTPARMPDMGRAPMIQPIKTPGGFIAASSRPVGDLRRIREKIPRFGEMEATSCSCLDPFAEDTDG